jgi:hypothetical protein
MSVLRSMWNRMPYTTGVVSRLNTSTADVTDAAPIAQWRFSGIAGTNFTTDLEEHDSQAVGGETRPLITSVAGTHGRGAESAAGDLLLEHLGKPVQV